MADLPSTSYAEAPLECLHSWERIHLGKRPGPDLQKPNAPFVRLTAAALPKVRPANIGRLMSRRPRTISRELGHQPPAEFKRRDRVRLLSQPGAVTPACTAGVGIYPVPLTSRDIDVLISLGWLAKEKKAIASTSARR
jgi:hypothetical protein